MSGCSIKMFVFCFDLEYYKINNCKPSWVKASKILILYIKTYGSGAVAGISGLLVIRTNE